MCLLIQNVIRKPLTKVCFRVVGGHGKSFVRVGVIFLLVKILQIGVVLVEKRIRRTSVGDFHMHVTSRTGAEAWSERSTATRKLKWSVVMVTVIVL